MAVTYGSDVESQKLKSLVESGNIKGAASQMQKMQDNYVSSGGGKQNTYDRYLTGTGSNVGKNYIGGVDKNSHVIDNDVESVWGDKNLSSGQKAMISANIAANKMGNAPLYSNDDINSADANGLHGWRYKDNYYVGGGKNMSTTINPTQRTTGSSGKTASYRGYGNEPEFGSYATGAESPQGMQYSWERTGGRQELVDGTYQFNPEGAANASAKDITKYISSQYKNPEVSGNIVDKGITTSGVNSVASEVPAWQETLNKYAQQAKQGDTKEAEAEIKRAQSVYNAKINSDPEGAERAHVWANQIREAIGMVAGGGVSAVNNGASGVRDTDEIIDVLRQQSDEQLIAQKAEIDIARDQAIMELEQALNTALAEGKIDLREAESQYDAKVKEINQQAYSDSEMLKLVAEERGIGNSKQMLGLMQGDQVRANSNKLTAMSDRDKRISDIKDRINALKANTNLGVANINADANNQMISAKSSNNAALLGNVAEILKEEWSMLANHKLNLEQLSVTQKYQLEQLGITHQYQLDEIAVQFQNELALQRNSQNFQASQNRNNESDETDKYLQSMFRGALSYGLDIKTYNPENGTIYAPTDKKVNGKYIYKPTAIEKALSDAEERKKLEMARKEAALARENARLEAQGPTFLND